MPEETAKNKRQTKPKTPTIPRVPLADKVLAAVAASGAGARSESATANAVPASGNGIRGGGGVRNLPSITAGDMFPGDWYQPSTKIPVIDEATYSSRLGTIKGQHRAVEVLIENLRLGRKVLIAEGLSVECETEATNNDIKREVLAATGVKLQQAGVKTGIEREVLTRLGVNLQQAQTDTAIDRVRLKTSQVDLQGYTIEGQLKAQVWNVKLEGLSFGLDEARLKLSSDRAALKAQFGNYSPSPLPKAV